MEAELTNRLVDALYGEAMVLADEARAWFDAHSRTVRDTLPPLAQIGLSAESLKVTTRLMHVVAWLLDKRAVARGEMAEAHVRFPPAALGGVQDGDPRLLAQLPFEALTLIEASRDLYDRVARLDKGIARPESPQSAVQGLFQRLEDAF